MSSIPAGFKKSSGHAEKISRGELDLKRAEVADKKAQEIASREAAKKATQEAAKAQKVTVEKNTDAYRVSITQRPKDSEPESTKPTQEKPTVQKDAPSEENQMFSKNPELQKEKARAMLASPYLKPEEKMVLEQALNNKKK